MEDNLYQNYEINKINWNDRYQVIDAVQKNGLNLCKCSESLRKDKEVCLQAIDNDPFSYMFIDESLRGDLDICSSVLTKNGWMYTKMPQSMKKNSRILKMVTNINKSLIKLSLVFKKKNMTLEDIKGADDQLKYDVINDILAFNTIHKTTEVEQENVTFRSNSQNIQREYENERELS